MDIVNSSKLVKFNVLALFFLSFYVSSYSQKSAVNRNNYKLTINKTSEIITIDGLLDEDTWKNADIARDFYRMLPIDTGFASAQTEVMMAYDETYIYLGAICHDTIPGKRPVESLRRDFSFGKNDNFITFIDTYNDQTNGFAFGVSASGAQWDGIQANGGFVSREWDTKWKSAVKNFEKYWVAEFAIPFRSIRYNGGDDEWGISFSRLDLKQSEKSSWTPIPRQFQSANLAYTGTLSWDKPLPKSGPRFSVIPYVSGKGTHDIEAGEDMHLNGNAGLDAKVILSSSMNLDLTINPDFSQVEVDQQRTDLDRFELFFPEKRQFFLENSDLFASLGTDNIRPFFSRRIGLENPVRGGARLSGRVGNNWRLGLMNMQTGTHDSFFATNYSVAAVQRNIFSRSNVAAFIVNKQENFAAGDLTSQGMNKYNRVAGIDLNLASADSKWTGKVMGHHSFYPDADGNASTFAGIVNYETQKMEIGLSQSWVGADYLAEVGYIRRTGYFEVAPHFGYRFYPGSKSIANHGPTLEYSTIYDTDLNITDYELEIGYRLEWLNRTLLTAEYENGYIKLLAPFDPTNTDGDTLATGSEYRWNEFKIDYLSDIRKSFNYEVGIRYGGYFNGTRMSLEGTLNYRVQPYGYLALVATYNQIELPKPYNSANLMLIGPRLDITFTDKVFLTTFVQYNNQIDNLNLNVRFQWRYAPGSDLYIVYTENTYTENFQSKNRGVVLKLSYWLN